MINFIHNGNLTGSCGKFIPKKPLIKLSPNQSTNDFQGNQTLKASERTDTYCPKIDHVSNSKTKVIGTFHLNLALLIFAFEKQ